jgi:hypothetical protein
MLGITDGIIFARPEHGPSAGSDRRLLDILRKPGVESLFTRTWFEEQTLTHREKYGRKVDLL